MPDTFDDETRSRIMSKVKSSGNKSTELRLISLFIMYDIHGWKRNYNVKGHPDFVFLKDRIAVFVDGCFWHGHNCRNTKPKDNSFYWERKISRNIMHDREITESFQSRGWVVIRIWECELSRMKQDQTIKRLISAINKASKRS